MEYCRNRFLLLRSQLDVNKIRESLQAICTECGHSIAPIDLVGRDNERVRCPACGKDFVPVPKAGEPTDRSHSRSVGTLWAHPPSQP
jgi:predicted RNA-binding Zn-ribbon protein involved in translation (DUF1610 family)